MPHSRDSVGGSEKAGVGGFDSVPATSAFNNFAQSPSTRKYVGLECFSQLLQQTEHFCWWRQQKVAKIVPYAPPLHINNLLSGVRDMQKYNKNVRAALGQFEKNGNRNHNTPKLDEAISVMRDPAGGIAKLNSANTATPVFRKAALKSQEVDYSVRS